MDNRGRQWRSEEKGFADKGEGEGRARKEVIGVIGLIGKSAKRGSRRGY